MSKDEEIEMLKKISEYYKRLCLRTFEMINKKDAFLFDQAYFGKMAIDRIESGDTEPLDKMVT